MQKRLFTSESVTEGHPDKICDQISDAVLDAILAQDPMARVACETCATTGMVMVMGEMTTNANISVEEIVRETVKKIGYDGFLTIEREVGENPAADIGTAVQFLKKVMEEN